jgi:uncharacterized membrane protein HdeD (DUF308 family)
MTDGTKGMATAAWSDAYRAWLSYVLLGALLAICGLAAVLAPAISTFAASTVFGVCLAAAGLFCVVQALLVKERDWFNWRLLIGAIAVLGGIVIIFSPIKGAAAITLIIALSVGGLGLTQAGFALRLRPARGWHWLMLASIASIAIAVALVARFPFKLTESPGAMAGISLIFGGLAYVMIGLGRRENLSVEMP